MANTEEKSGKKGWFRAALGAVAGLCSGAVIMYLTPLVDKVIKGNPPLANFEASADGLNVSFHNLSTPSTSLEGWWDFGDGSALTPLAADKEVRHTYPRPGAYTAKLTIRTLLGETNDRSVPIQLDGGPTDPPHILTLDAKPITPGALAPATFKLTSQMKGVQLAVWDLAEGRPLEVSPPTEGPQERFLTFEKPGNHVIKLAAFNGQLHEEKTLTVNVLPAPVGSLAAVLTVNDQGTQVERHERKQSIPVFFPPNQKGNSYSFKEELKAPRGSTISDVQVPRPQGPALSLQGRAAMALDAANVQGGSVRNLQLQRDPDGLAVRLTGEMVRNSSKEMPMMMLPVVLKEERRKPAPVQPIPIKVVLPVPGTTQLDLPSLPQGWEAAKRQLQFELWDGNREIWQAASLPSGVQMNLRSRNYVLTATQTGAHVQISLNELTPAR
jgi:PKD repeat protein